MKQWIIQALMDNIIPIILTGVLGLVGVKLKHIKDALVEICDAIADGKIDKDEWKGIRAKIKVLIGR